MASVLIFSMFISNPIILVMSILGGLCMLKTYINTSQLLKSVIWYIALFIIVAATNPLFSHEGVTVLFFMNDKPITLESVRYGIKIALMIISVFIWSRCYNFVMTSEKFIYIFGKITPKIALVMSMTFRFIPMYRRKSREIYGFECANYPKEKLSYIDKIILGFKTFSIVMTWSFENAIDTANSMKARGYSSRKRTFYSIYKFRFSDIAGVVFLILVWAIAITCSLRQNIEYTFYPLVIYPKLNEITIFMYTTMGALFFIPSIIELEESLRWKYYRLKI